MRHRLRRAKLRLAGVWPPGRSQFGGRMFCLGLLLLAVLLLARPVSAQEALQNSLTGQTVAKARDQQLQNPDYTFKNGDFRMLVSPYLSAQWNDNVNLAQTNLMDDYIITPGVGIAASYPLTQRNVLFLDVSIGYQRYLKHPSLSAFTINSATRTGLSFDIGIKDVTLNLHDWFSYSQDSAQSSAVANTANFGTFQNTAGLSATWDLNQVTLSAGYDHQNVLSTSGNFNNINHSAEQFFLRSGFQVHPEVTLGLETTASFTRYDKSGSGVGGSQNGLNNNNAYTVGPYVTFTPGHYFTVTARGGYSTYQFQQTSQSIQTSSQNTWYASVNVSHQILEFLSYSLAVGHETQLGVQSDLNEDDYVRPNITWKIIKDWDFSTGFFYEHGKQGVGSVFTGTGNLNQNYTYDWYGGSLTLSHALTRRLSLGLNYRLTLRSSDQPNQTYTQNLVGLQLTYHP